MASKGGLVLVIDSDNNSNSPMFQVRHHGDSGPVLFQVQSDGTTSVSGTSLTVNGSTVWHTGNDGASSGLDADKLDGVQGSSYLRSDADDTYTGTLSVAGTIKDSGDSRRIHYMYGTTNSQPAFGLGEQGVYGMKMRWDSGARIEFDGFWNTSVTGARNRDLGSIDVNNAIWELPSGVIINGNTVWHAGNDGASSGLDADLLDGVQGGSYLRSDATDTASGKLTFGYSVSNLNSVGGAIGVTPFRGSFQATNRPGSGNYFTGHEYTFSDTGARAQLGFGSDGQNTVPHIYCLLYTSPSPRDLSTSRMPSSA